MRFARRYTAAVGGCLALLLVCGLAGRRAHAQDRPTLTVTSGQKQPVQAKPGTVLTLPFSVRSKVPGRYVASVSSPNGWRPLATGRSFQLDAGTPATRLIALSVPRAVQAGDYTVVYRVRHRSRKTIRDTLRIPVRVPVRRNVRLEAVRSPTFVVGGDTLAVTLRVDNASNVPATVRLRRSTSLGTPLGDAPRLALDPGATRRTTVRTVLPADVTTQTEVELELDAQVRDTSLASLRLTTPVFPSRRFRKGSRYHRYPLTLTGTTSGVRRPGRSEIGYQFAVDGEGPLWEGSRTTFAIQARAPGVEDAGFFLRRRTHFSLDVQHPNARLNLGDQSFSLTNLAQGTGRFGAGAGLSWGNIGAYGYAARSRFGVESRHAGGRLYARWGPADENVVGLNGVVKEGRIQGRLLTANVDIRPVDNIQLAVEHGRSTGSSGDGTATQARGDVEFAYGSIGARYLQVDANYPELGGAQHSVGGTFTLSPPIPLSLRGGASVNRFGQSNRGRLNVTLGIGRLVTLGYQQSRLSREPASVWTPEVRRDALLFRVGAGGENLQVNVRARIGTVRDTARTAPALNQRYEAQASLEATRWLDLRFQGEYQDETFLRGTGRQTEIEGRIRADLQLTNNTDAGVSVVLRKRLRSLLGTTPLQVRTRVQLSHTFPQVGHTLSLNARFSRGALGILRSGLSLQYEAPLKVPIHRSQQVGTVQGRLLDSSTGEGVAGIPLRLGEQGVVTDARGTFVFAGMDPGTYRLRVDREALGPKQMLKSPPGQVHVQGGEETSVRLHVTTTGSIAGRVRIERRRGVAADTGRIEPLGGARVVLSEDGESRTQFTGSDGRFVFYGVPPDTHTVRLLERSLPARTRPETARKTIIVEGRETEEVTFMVRPRRRKLQLLTPGDTSVAEVEVGETDEAISEPTDESKLLRPMGTVGTYVVQVGAFRSRSNAETRARRIRQNGRTVFLQPQRWQGRLHQVWVGRYTSRSAAEQAVDSLKSYAPDAYVVEVRPGTCAVQVGAFRFRSNAETRARRIRQNGRTVFLQSQRWQGRLHQVWVGRYTSRSAAERVVDSLKSYAPNAYVVEVRPTDPYTIRLGTFSDSTAALRQARAVRQEGIPAYLRRKQRDGNPVYAVWAGSYDNRRSAEKHIPAFTAYASDPTVVRVSP